jgi:predicted dehydrogenase
MALRAVFDVDDTRARAVATTGTDVVVASTADEAIRSPDVDLVIVATPHRELPVGSLAALDAGRHLLIEKPAAADVAAARAIATHPAASSHLVRVGFNHRFHPAIVEARRLVASGVYGRVLHLRGRYGHGGRPGYEREWRSDRSRSGGGELIDQGVHLIDLTRALVGEVTMAFSELRTSFWAMDVEDNAFVALAGADGSFAWLHASWTEWKNLFSLEITLERAKVEVTGLGGSYGAESLTRYEMLPEMGPPRVHREEWEDVDRSWRDELVDVAGALEGRPAAGATIHDAVAALEIVAAAYGSSP